MQTEKNIERQKIIVQIFSFEHFDEMVKLLATHFLQHNPIWKNCADLTFEQTVQFFKIKISPCLHNKLSLVFKLNGKIIGGEMIMSIQEYLQPQRIPIKSEFLQKNSSMSRELQKELYQKKYQQKQAGYSPYLFVDKTITQKGLCQLFMLYGMIRMKRLGYKYGYARISNEYSLKGALKAGAYIIKQTQFSTAQFKQKISLIKFPLNLDLQKNPAYGIINKYFVQPTAKL